MTLVVRCLFLAALVGGVPTTPPTATPPAGVRDEGRFFSPAATTRANERIKEMRERYGGDLVVETFPGIPAARQKDYRPEKRNEFFSRWARERARENKLTGVLILITRDPSHLQIDRESVNSSFTPSDRNKLRDLLLKRFKEKKFDDGLGEAVAFVADRFRDSAPVRDEGGFFQADVIRRAIQSSAELRRQYGKELVVETFQEIPPERKKDYSDEKKDRFFQDWARERSRQRKVDGIYILITRTPARVEVTVGDDMVKKAFTRADKQRLVDLLLRDFRQKHYDEGLAGAIKLIEGALKANLAAGRDGSK